MRSLALLFVACVLLTVAPGLCLALFVTVTALRIVGAVCRRMAKSQAGAR